MSEPEKYVRRYVFKLYPTPAQERKLTDALRLHCTLYNAAIEERINAYRKTANARQQIVWGEFKGRRGDVLEGYIRHHLATPEKMDGSSIGYYEQSRKLKDIRASDPEYAALDFHALAATLERVDRAFKAFFRRVKEEHKNPGFPRFRAWQRFTGFGYKAAPRGNPRRKSGGRGYRFLVTGPRAARLYLDDLGVSVRARGKFPDFLQPDMAGSHSGSTACRGSGDDTPEFRGDHRAPYSTVTTTLGDDTPELRGDRQRFEFLTCDIRRDAAGWEVSVVVEYERPSRDCGAVHCGIDIGTETYAAVANEDGSKTMIANPRWFQSSADKTRAASRAVSSKNIGSNNRARAVKRLVRLLRKDKNRRKHWQHVKTTEFIRTHGFIATEELGLANMTRTARGTEQNPGTNVRQKAGLNREMRDLAAGQFLQLIKYKAEEAGAVFMEAPTKSLKPSQRCPRCGSTKQKTLSERTHECAACGYQENRDVAAAQIMLLWAETVTGQHKFLNVMRKHDKGLIPWLKKKYGGKAKTMSA